jgi:hypothetical protein
MSLKDENKAELAGYLGSPKPLGTTLGEDMAFKRGQDARPGTRSHVSFAFDETVPLWLQLLVFAVVVIAGTTLYLWLRTKDIGPLGSGILAVLGGLATGGAARLFVESLKFILLAVVCIGIYWLARNFI